MSKPHHRRAPGTHPNQRPPVVYFPRVTVHLAATDDQGLNAQRRVFQFASFRVFPISGDTSPVLSVTEQKTARVTMFPFYRVDEIVAETEPVTKPDGPEGPFDFDHALADPQS